MSAAVEGNVFYQAGRALLTQLDKHEQASDPTLLLAGSESEVEKRWACSAIKLKQDAGWLVVPKAGPVQMGDTRRVCARSPRKTRGRRRFCYTRRRLLMRRNRRAHMRTIAYDEGSAAYGATTVPCRESERAGCG